jgi:hypothetical protein
MLNNGTERGVNKLKKYYVEYVRHCLRFYVMTLDMGTSPRFNTEVDRNNWKACDLVVKNIDPKTVEVIKEIYRPGDTISDKVYRLAREMKVSQESIWNMVNTLERNIAKKRGLL